MPPQRANFVSVMADPAGSPVPRRSRVLQDESTLDLFPDDPTRALVESMTMTIDARQRTLPGFELPAVVRAAVEAAQGTAEAASLSRPPARAKDPAADVADSEAKMSDSLF